MNLEYEYEYEITREQRTENIVNKFATKIALLNVQARTGIEASGYSG